MTKHLLRACVATVAPLIQPAPASASYIFGFSGGVDGVLSITTTTGVFNIDLFDTGWYRADGFHGPDNLNYIACLPGSADCGSSIPESHNFSAFRLGTVTGTFLSATYSLFNPAAGATDTADFSLWDFTGNIDGLLARAGGVGGFTDLGSGVSFGIRVVGIADNNTMVTTNLNAAALAAISAALSSNGGSGLFVIGGAADVSTIPEPATMSLLGLGLAAGIARRRRARSSR